MNLAATMEMFFGGPGSGCRGPNCGRPAGGEVAEHFHKEAEWIDPTPGSRFNPINVGDDVKRAAKLIRENKHVVLNQPIEVATLVDKIKREAAAFHDEGKPIPDFNLADISVKGTNLFAGENVGMPRVEMPQFAGTVDPGSPAAALLPKGSPPDAEVDLAPEFIKSMKDQGVGVQEETVPASSLRSTQEQLDGVKVASIVTRAEAGKLPSQPIFVTKDNYILDGHHRWAAEIVMDAKNNREGDLKIPVHKLDIDIGRALTLGLEFQKKWGISRARVGGEKPQEWLPASAAIEATILIYGGGLGSGCRGPNCGRPREPSYGAIKMPRGRQTLRRVDQELRNAAGDKRVVLMEYKKDDETKAKSYMLEPYSYRDDGKSFFGYDIVDKGIKKFNMMNIVRVSPTGKKFVPRWKIEL
jgi:hypothetical protein